MQCRELPGIGEEQQAGPAHSSFLRRWRRLQTGEKLAAKDATQDFDG